MNIPMHTPHFHMLSLQQCPGTDHALVGHSLHATCVHQSLVRTPFHTYRYGVSSFWAGRGSWRSGDSNHCPNLHQRTLLAEVAHLAAPPARLSRRLRGPPGGCMHWR